MSYEFLQHYWWFLVSLLGALLVFLMFVQGANTLIFTLGKTENERRLVVNSTGRKWEFTWYSVVVSLHRSHCFIVQALEEPIGFG